MTRRRSVVSSLLAVALSLPALTLAQEPKPSPRPMRLSVSGGTVANLSADASGVVPFSRISVDAPISTSAMGPRLRVEFDLTGLSGESVATGDPQSYRAIEFAASLRQPLPRPLLASIYVETGFASRLPGDPAPRDKAPRWVAGGLGLENDSGTAGFDVGIAGDQRLSGRYVLAAHAKGHVKVYETKGVSVSIVGSAILGISFRTPATPTASPPRDSIRAGISLGV